MIPKWSISCIYISSGITHTTPISYKSTLGQSGDLLIAANVAEIQNYLLPYGSLGPTGHDPYGSESTGNGSHHWCFYSMEILRCIPRTQVVSMMNPFWVHDAGRSDFGITSPWNCRLLYLWNGPVLTVACHLLLKSWGWPVIDLDQLISHYNLS